MKQHRRHPGRILAGISIVTLLAPAVCTLPLMSQERDSSQVSPTRLAVFGGVATGTMIGVHLHQQQAWWNGPKGSFWLYNDWKYARGVDKLGHMYGAYVATALFHEGFRWCGFSRRSSLLLGVSAGLALELYVEIEDGFHEIYGFSPGDAMADFLGAGFFLAQETLPVLENFRLKWSYWPSSDLRDGLRRGENRTFLDDYEGQKHWLAVDPHFALGEDLARLIPSWLGVAVGYGVEGSIRERGDAKGVFYIALDYNFRRLAPGDGLLHTLFHAIDFIHLPAPGIAIHESGVRFGLVY